MKQIYVESYFKGFRSLQGYSLLKGHPQREVIERRLKIISFYERHGGEATRDAFGVSRSTVFLWKKKLREADGRIISLAPVSTAPIGRRKRETHPLIVSFIKDYRLKHPGVSKETIQPQLDLYCQNKAIENGIRVNHRSGNQGS